MGLKDNILDVENDLPSVGVDFLKYLLSIDTGDSVSIDKVVVFFAEVDGTVFSIGTSIGVGV